MSAQSLRCEAANERARRAARVASPAGAERQVWLAFFDAMRMVMPVGPGGVRIVTGETFADFDKPTAAHGPRTAGVSPL